MIKENGRSRTQFKKGFTPWNKNKGRPKSGNKECEYCHKKFDWTVTGKSNPAPKTCSKECRYALCATHTGRINRGGDGVPLKIKKQAERMVQTLTKRGIIKKTPCVFCGENKLRIVAHHYKGYARENWLDILWLCDKCHKLEHKRLRKLRL